MLTLKIDCSVGGIIRYCLIHKTQYLMQVPDEVKKCVVFIGCNTQQGVVWGGTGFFIGIEADGFKGQYFNYLITAKHCIDAIKEQSTDQKVLIRINLKSNSIQTISSNLNDWKFHPTEKSSVDVATLPWNPPEQFDYLTIPTDSMTLTDALIKEQGIGAGDEVFLTGLFRMHSGTQKNLPIIRTGNIARMPEEKIPVKMYDGTRVDIDAYLIEGRSIGGLSGSPVFLYLGVIRNIDGSIKFVSGAKSGAFHWLGLTHGHWDIPEGTIDAIMDNTGNGNKSVNVGIAIVVPAQKVLEVVNQQELVKKRKHSIEQWKKPEKPSLDSTNSAEESNKTLKKVSQ